MQSIGTSTAALTIKGLETTDTLCFADGSGTQTITTISKTEVQVSFADTGAVTDLHFANLQGSKPLGGDERVSQCDLQIELVLAPRSAVRQGRNKFEAPPNLRAPLLAGVWSDAYAGVQW